MTSTPTDPRLLLDADALPYGLIVFDKTGKAIRINRKWTELTHQSDEHAMEDGWLRAIATSDRQNAAAHVRTVLAGQGPRVTDWRLQPSRLQPQRWIRVHVEVAGADAGDAVGCFAYVEDSDEDHNRELQLEYQATHDALTGVLTRAQFVQQTRHALARLTRHPGTLALVFIDFDDFKEVNDRHGHVFGDRVLAAQAGRFNRAVRPTDIVARYGGDEFVVLCEDLGSGDEARLVAERIVFDLGQPHHIDDHTIELHASVGVVTTDDPHADLTTLFEHADLAMYRAKQRGRDCVEVESLAGDADTSAEIIDLELERQRDWQTVLTRIHHQLRDAETALGRLWADEIPRHEADTASRLADAARYVSRAVRSLSDDVIA